MIANYKNELQKVFDIKDGKIKEGLKLDISEIDEYFRFKRNAMVVIVGHANVGKTHLCVYLMTLYSLKHGTRWLIYSSENEVSDLLRKIIEFQAAKPIDSISKYDIEQYAKWANAYFKFIQPDKLYDYKELLEEAEEFMKTILQWFFN
jgi:DNA replication protein DnaC